MGEPQIIGPAVHMLEQPMASYHHPKDTRMNFHEVANLSLKAAELEKIKSNALAVACLMPFCALTSTESGYKLSSSVQTLTNRVYEFENPLSSKEPKEKFNAHLADTEKFRNELTPGFGTAFLVGSNRRDLLTAGHCVAKLNSSIQKDITELNDIRVVFRFHHANPLEDKTTFDAKDVYTIESVISYSYVYMDNSFPDWAIIRLTKEVVGEDIRPIELDCINAEVGRQIYTIGCPTGTAVKVAGLGYSTIKERCPDIIYSDSDILCGNSGGPQFDRQTHKAVAITVRGYGDYRIDETSGKVIQYRITPEMITNKTSGYASGQRITQAMISKTVSKEPEINMATLHTIQYSPLLGEFSTALGSSVVASTSFLLAGSVVLPFLPVALFPVYFALHDRRSSIEHIEKLTQELLKQNDMLCENQAREIATKYVFERLPRPAEIVFNTTQAAIETTVSTMRYIRSWF